MAATLVLAGGLPACAHPARGERLDRGLVAATVSDGVHLSWRLLGQEATGATSTGIAGPDFAVYSDGKRIATVTDSTTFVDAKPTPGAVPGRTPASRCRVGTEQIRDGLGGVLLRRATAEARGRRNPGQ